MEGKLAVNGGPQAVPPGLKKRWPEITEEDKAAVLGVLERNKLSGVDGPESLGLEADWASYTGSKHVLTFNSGTAAIHAALFAAGVGPGDEVITSAFSFSGSFHPILHQNAVPVFVDIDPRTYNLDVAQIEAKITDQTRALLPVHIHGLPADMDELLALGQEYNIPVIEDACQAHGATYKGQMAGTIGDIGCFSLNVTKNLSGGEGGLLNTDSDEYVERARLLRTFGERIGQANEKFRPYYSYSIGWNYRTQEMPAAFARSQLRRLDDYNAIAQRNGEYLSRELAKLPGLIPPHVPPDRTTVYHKYRLRLDPAAWGIDLGRAAKAVAVRDRLLEALEAEGVAVTLWHLTPLPAFPVFQASEEPTDGGRQLPWNACYYDGQVDFDPAHYPESQRLLDESLVINDEAYPIYIQDLELMEYYVAAFRKVLGRLDVVFD